MGSPTKERIFFFALGVPVVICLLAFFWIAAALLTGVGTLNLELITTSALRGGLFEMIVGTVYLFIGATAIAGPIGVFAAIYLVEYAPAGKATRIIDQAINNLAGVPSIIIGLFGYTLFSRQLGFGISLLSGWLTLSLMILPIVIRGSEEAIRIVPTSFKQAALALGATKWKSISLTTLIAAAPGVVTSLILGIARVAGETAAILFTSSVLITRGLPSSPFEPVMTLSFNMYVKIVAQGESPDSVFGIALILFFIVLSFSLVAIILRVYYRRKQPWLD
ncbi:MAG: phosphate ABC transporter permease PstA [Candidatus Bathyarchaeota archaeon]|nr:phosphate ABC transporter permease PstA [Candidatus Bathyarchaeum tardum]WGM89738.1 MAG: phosphate ABC transporter permease PstA [Candidatus Bathyarchaeum tardum]WNZ30166.1 MAG: phosphate ABC transporter permease PstA [Candidatus Bathyarchaeota archaeon]